MRRFRQVLVLVAVVALVGGGLVLRAGLRGVEQPIAFNHRLHIEEVGVGCTDCHLYAVNGTRATIPNIEICSDCHDEALTESDSEAYLLDLVEAGEKIPWRKVYTVPDHVFFSHRRHTAIGGLECDRCHGDVGGRVLPVARPAADLSMGGCMDCHEESGVSNDCLLCHI